MNAPSNQTAPSRASANKANWPRYLDLLTKHRVPEPQRRWYARHVEQLIDAFPGRKLASLTRDEIEGYLRQLGADPQTPAWQLRQKVDALRLLWVELLASDAAQPGSTHRVPFTIVL